MELALTRTHIYKRIKFTTVTQYAIMHEANDQRHGSYFGVFCFVWGLVVFLIWFMVTLSFINTPDSKVLGVNVGPTCGGQDPGEPYVGHMNFAIWDRGVRKSFTIWVNKSYESTNKCGPLYWHGLTPAWTSNYIHYIVWDEIIHPSLNFKVQSISKFHPTLYQGGDILIQFGI